MPFTSDQRQLQHVPIAKGPNQMHVRSLTSGANTHKSEDEQLKIRYVTPTNENSPSAPVQCNICVKSLVHRGEWHTVPALKFVHTDKFQKRRSVYLRLNQSEPNEAEQAAEWPEVCVMQRNTEIQIESAQPDSEQKEVTRSLKVVERHDFDGRLFWREVLPDPYKNGTKKPLSLIERIKRDEAWMKKRRAIDRYYGRRP